MVHPRNRGAARRFGAAAALALAGVLLASRPSAAQQVWISPDRSIVNVGPRPPVMIRANYSPTVVVVPGNRSVRVGGAFSATVVYPSAVGYPAFVQPQGANERAQAANFYGSRNYNPNPVVTGPFQKWW
jgi:hypothetical protein